MGGIDAQFLSMGDRFWAFWYIGSDRPDGNNGPIYAPVVHRLSLVHGESGGVIGPE